MAMDESTLRSTDFHFPNQTSVYHGKVRDVYTLGNDRILMIATDRLSAFDYILPRAIPYKGQVLNQIAQYFLEATSDIVPNWLEACPDPNVSFGHLAKPFALEIVVRGYLAGHAWRTYRSGNRLLCGVTLPEGLSENDRLPEPIITPTTKVSEGHDEDISEEDILKKGIVIPEEWTTLKKYALTLFEKGTQMAAERGLILVDTKYEFGVKDGEIILIDEIHTPDSSRYFYADGYEERQKNKEHQPQLSKEFVREWLIENGFQGLDGQVIPDMNDDFVNSVSKRYIQLYETITGKTFKKSNTTHLNQRIENNVNNYLATHRLY